MNKLRDKLIYLLKVVIFISFFSVNFKTNEVKTQSNSTSNQINEIKKGNLIKSEYLLDTGDELYINFISLDPFSNTYLVNRDGKILFPEIGFIDVRGLSISDLQETLLFEYENIIIDSEIEIFHVKYRPVTLFLSGELNRPGLYKMDNKSQNTLKVKGYDFNLSAITGSQALNTKTFNVSGIQKPTVFDAVKLGNGITNYADLSKVTIIRKNSKKNGGGKIKTTVNLIDLILRGEIDQNIEVYDGDNIFVPKSTKIIKDQLLAINKTNLTPDLVTVFINGNIPIPGTLRVPQNSSLIEAIVASGGQNSFSGNIEFIRFNSFGERAKRIIKYDLKAEKGSLNNPTLLNGDIIIVRKNILGKSTSFIKEVGAPIFSGYGLYKLFND